MQLYLIKPREVWDTIGEYSLTDYINSRVGGEKVVCAHKHMVTLRGVHPRKRKIDAVIVLENHGYLNEVSYKDAIYALDMGLSVYVFQQKHYEDTGEMMVSPVQCGYVTHAIGAEGVYGEIYGELHVTGDLLELSSILGGEPTTSNNSTNWLLLT